MSEYQYYEFTAIDKPLTSAQMSQLRSISTRATITPVGFVNEYHWGDLKGDPRRMVEAYFDAFLYTANWGTRQVMLKIPKKLVSPATVEQYCYTEVAEAWVKGAYVVIDLSRSSEYGEDEEDQYWDESSLGEGMLASIVPARAGLIDGDLRLLYLAWLLSVDLGLLEDDELEPPVPANLGALTGSLTALVAFLGIDPDLVVAAAEASRDAVVEDDEAELASWISALPTRTKNATLLKLVRGDDPLLGQGLRRQFQESRGPSAPLVAQEEMRTVGDLLYRAAQLRAESERRTAEAERTAQARREAAAAARREEKLDALAVEGNAVWQRVEDLVAQAKPKLYAEAVDLLIDLRDLGQRDGDAGSFDRVLASLRERYAHRPALLRRVDEAGL
jgi:hypothetical protein